MAGLSSQPLFSRDLKYMLDARHSAAPRRRSAPRGAIALLAVVVLAVGLWTGTRMTGSDDEARRAPVPVRNQTKHEPEYTQPDSTVSKTIASQRTAMIMPHPPESESTEPAVEWKTYSVRRGDTLGKIFKRFSIDIGLASTVAQHETGSTLKKLMPEHKIHFGFDADGRLLRLRYELNRLEELVVSFEDSRVLAASKRNIPTKTRERSASQEIGSSLFVSASEAGLSDRLIMQLVSVFGWDIDFALDIRSGDRFSILYEEMFRNGESVGTGDILAAEFDNDGNVFHAIRHVDDDGRKQYFDLEGVNLRGTFLRTPMQVSRITSGFSKRRYHPVLKKWRAHRGVDYGAPAGTPVLATGDGRVHSIGRNGGYGKVIVLKHGGQYSTLYAHLSGFEKGMKRGARVRQGDVIGYVGSTGLATGPHLHYEFRVNGTHRNPLTYETPKAQPIDERYREAFLAMARERIDQLNDARGEQVASR